MPPLATKVTVNCEIAEEDNEELNASLELTLDEPLEVTLVGSEFEFEELNEDEAFLPKPTNKVSDKTLINPRDIKNSV